MVSHGGAGEVSVADGFALAPDVRASSHLIRRTWTSLSPQRLQGGFGFKR